MRIAVILLFLAASSKSLFAQQTRVNDSAFLFEPQYMPEYPGGEDSMMRFVAGSLNYPQSAIKDSVQGRVVVRFTVNESGRPIDFVVAKGVRKDLDEEALRVVRLLSRFQTNRVNGKASKVSYNLPITFSLDEQSRTIISKAAPPRVNVPHIYDAVDQMPEFPGGADSLKAFIARNLNYPPDDGADVQGRVVLDFVVNEDGGISAIAIRRNLHPAFDAEAIRVAKLFPSFIPGKLQGKAVKVRYVMPIMFR